MQVGGGINEDNAEEWLQAGASKVGSVLIRPQTGRSSKGCEVEGSG